MVMAAIPVERGCGTRKRGGIYGECGLSPWGQPLEAFLMDPPVPVDPAGLGLSPIGVTLLNDPATGATHILDWVGEEHYPNVCDALEEIRRFGLSRRLPRTLDFSRLDAHSRILLVHRRGLLADVSAYASDWRRSCPKALPEHADPAHAPSLCAGIWWEDVSGGEEDAAPEGQPADPRRIRRTMPSFSYVARAAPPGVAPAYAPAIVASFPLSRLVVIRDPEGGTDRTALDRAGRASLPVDLEEA
jgi:hypothetical protein